MERTYRDLESYGFEVQVHPANCHLELLKQQIFAIVIGPGLLPVHTAELCRGLRPHCDAPIIAFLEAPSGDHISTVLDAGADHCFDQGHDGLARLILSAAEAVKRRGERLADLRGGVIEAGQLRIDFERRIVTLGESPIPLTATEYAILTLLTERPGQLLSPAEILRAIHGQEYEPGEARDIVKVHVSRLRQKLEADPVAARCIVNVRGQGYKYAFDRRGADHRDLLSALAAS
jgi:two-component system KDP operon response regulator KdpE